MFRSIVTSAPVIALGLLTAGIFGSDVGRTTELRTPRFVSLKAKPANVRVGPGIDYPLKWTFLRRNLPVEIIAEFGNWREIRDWEGKRGWMLAPLLSGKRTGLVAPWAEAKSSALHAEAARTSTVVAIMQPHVLVRIIGCDGRWCEVRAKARQGYVRQANLWGAYQGEVF